jgi:hypothetical protein
MKHKFNRGWFTELKGVVRVIFSPAPTPAPVKAQPVDVRKYIGSRIYNVRNN